MLRQIWQWLKGLFRRLFGTPPKSSSNQGEGVSLASPLSQEPPPLADSDYEYLFRQLLEGVTHGWQQDRVLRWFDGLKGRTTEAAWVAWLRRFGERVLESQAPNHELGMRLVQLGQVAQPIPSLREIGEVAYDIGRQLLPREVQREPSEEIWEYEGLDAYATASSFPSPEQDMEQANEEIPQLEPITLDELFARLQQDANLVQLVAQQLGLETSDPQVIIQEVINQLNAANQSAISQAETWFNQGVEQDEAGDFAGAIASYDQALEITPGLNEVWFNRGNALSKLGRFEEAIISYDKAIEINPDLHEAWHNRGNALSSLGRLEEASTSYNKAKEIQG